MLRLGIKKLIYIISEMCECVAHWEQRESVVACHCMFECVCFGVVSWVLDILPLLQYSAKYFCFLIEKLCLILTEQPWEKFSIRSTVFYSQWEMQISMICKLTTSRISHVVNHRTSRNKNYWEYNAVSTKEACRIISAVLLLHYIQYCAGCSFAV